MKSRSVKRTFFREGSILPSYELENGEVKHAYTNKFGILYLTDAEHKAHQERAIASTPKKWYQLWK